MSDDNVQNYGNHVRWFPPWHFVVMPILVVNFLLALKSLIQLPSMATGWSAFLAFTIVAAFILCRWMPLRVQDRVIRNEMRLRLAQVLPADLVGQILRLERKQLVALRFASDAELPALVRDVLAGSLTATKDIKLRVKDWQGDTLRA